MREVEDTARRCETCQSPILSGRFCRIDRCRKVTATAERIKAGRAAGLPELTSSDYERIYLAMQAASPVSDDAVERVEQALAAEFPTLDDTWHLRSIAEVATAALSLPDLSEPACAECNGTGTAEMIGGYPRPCDACHGSGEPVVGPSATVDDLKARLVAKKSTWPNKADKVLVNPDGPEALARIEALEYVLTAHGEQLHDAFDQAHRALAKARGEQ